MKKVLFSFLFCGLIFYGPTACMDHGKNPPVTQDTVKTDTVNWYCQSINIAPEKTDRAVGAKGKFWTTGQTIKVGWLPGVSAAQIASDKACFAEWGKWVNLVFSYPATGPFDLRIAHQAGYGAWSYIGTDAKYVTTQTQPTINLGFSGINSRGLDYVALHEIAHALGYLHEQQTLGGVCWNEANVIQDLSGPPNNWSEATIRFNVLTPHNSATVISNGFDPTSIMMYAIPARWTCNGVGFAGGKDITQQDISFAQARYPGTVPPPPPPVTSVTMTAAQAAELKQAALNAQTATNAAKVAVDANRAKIQAILGQ